MLGGGKVLPSCTIIHTAVVGSHCNQCPRGIQYIICLGDERGRGRTITVGASGGACAFYVQTTSCALSLRNLVSGYECGRVFPAGVGPGSPSRDAANWLL